MNTDDDELVADYLRRLRAAAAALPEDRRDELLQEITAHIAEARAIGPADGSDPAAHVADVLARLGAPEAIVEAAGPGGAAGAGLGGGGLGGYGLGAEGLGGGASPWSATRPRSGPGGHEIAAVVLLLIGGFLAGIGWIVGVVLLWTSPRWGVRDKLLGTLIWPGGLALALLILVGLGIPAKTVCVSTSVSRAVAVNGPGSHVFVDKGHVVVNGPGGKVSVDQRGTKASSGHRGPQSQGCSPAGTGPSGELIALLALLLLLAVAGPVLVAIRLLRHAGQQPTGPARASPPAFQPT